MHGCVVTQLGAISTPQLFCNELGDTILDLLKIALYAWADCKTTLVKIQPGSSVPRYRMPEQSGGEFVRCPMEERLALSPPFPSPPSRFFCSTRTYLRLSHVIQTQVTESGFYPLLPFLFTQSARKSQRSREMQVLPDS